MSQISNIRNPWRLRLLSQQASFRDVMFHVEQGGKSSGRRTVLHEYPKRDLPYAEDMGQHAVRFNFSGYLIYKPLSPNTPENSVRYDYVAQRDRLVEALERADVGRLVHPVFCRNGLQVMCERYMMTESRERGGFTAFEMNFVQAGQAVPSTGVINSKASISSLAQAVEGAARNLLSVQ